MDTIRRNRLAYLNMRQVVEACLTPAALQRFLVEEELRLRSVNKNNTPRYDADNDEDTDDGYLDTGV